ncbi:MAG: aromatic ring-hydroxylating dioxygenase subunit alpha [Caulobacteraceae bacterium]|nr:aromatic ring-hydroxylating dioxygenase subunit alpha [Caulobacteraceae bacterium]
MTVKPKFDGEVRPSTYQDLLATDSRPAPALLGETTVDFGLEPVPASNYTSRAFFEKEIEKVWLKTWQYVCREEHVPEPGDTYVYDLLDKTAIVTRQPDGSLKAMQNVCLHRGRKLVTSGGCKQQFRCPYHGFTWNTDGSFRENPFGWDFPQIDPKRFSLPELRLETWAGFVFINFDPAATPLKEQMWPLTEHLEHWRIEDCTMVAHVGKIAHANWKACAEAFLESHHVYTTHPQINGTNAFESTQYDVLSDHVTRFISPVAVTSAFHPKLDDEQRVALLFGRAGMRMDSQAEVVLGPGQTARAYAAENARRELAAATGFDFEGAGDAEVTDGIAYDFFPSFHLWGGYRDKICYRFRPWEMDHEKTLLEVMLFRIAPKDGPKPPPAAFNMLGEDDPWSGAAELGFLAGVYDQDQSNMAPVQAGLRALGETGVVQFSRYQEIRCRNLHRMVAEYMKR